MSETRGGRGEAIAGADGCRGGWVAVMARVQSGGLEVSDAAVVADFAALMRRTRECSALAVDIPIGLSEQWGRTADFEARRRLGVPRSSSVFPVPPRLLLKATSYAEANALSWSVFGRGLPAQAYGILTKIREADTCMRPELQERIVEVHPEVSFWSLAGDEPMRHSKRSAEGRAERLALLEAVYGTSIRALTPPRGAALDDLYDACVLAWTASHVAAGTAVHLPASPQRDERGLRMEIVY